MTDELYQIDNQITQPTFCAGLEVRGDMIVNAVPILWHRAKRISAGHHPRWSEFLAHCVKAGWKVTRV